MTCDTMKFVYCVVFLGTGYDEVAPCLPQVTSAPRTEVVSVSVFISTQPFT